ncbi:glycosyltransferase family 2 protein [Rhizobium sp. KVB221]|uniref:Glycosyltransferase family 2 protein n=1 Tax=Rhizobium setariae TaxID=2801340 RepID=A0A936YU68_9HYPH|nr:glycosyltransferase family 2 protein [Rhizobium setariae]MBL0373216.1 glycosyltransferase family 2 protein [Rhizobium setariae]
MSENTAPVDVSVIVRTKDRPVLLGRALKSLAAQTSRKFEVIIINDGGDASVVENILAGVRLPEYLLTSNDESIGRAKAFNQALRMARGEFVACLDDDDTYEPKFIENMAYWLQHEIRHDRSTAGLICRCLEVYEELQDSGGRNYLHENTGIKQVKTEVLHEYNSANTYISPYFYYVGRENFLPVQTLFRRSVLMEFGGFSEKNDVLEDRPVYNKILSTHRVAVHDEVLANHHTRVSKNGDAHSNSMHDNMSYNWGRKFAEFYTSGYYDKQQAETFQFAFVRDALLDLKWDLTSTKMRRQEFDSLWQNLWRLIRRNKLTSFVVWLVFVLSMITYSAIGTALVLYFNS